MKEDIIKYLQSVELLGLNRNLEISNTEPSILKIPSSANFDKKAFESFGIDVLNQLTKTYCNEIVQMLYKKLMEKLSEEIEDIVLHDFHFRQVKNVILYGSSKNILHNKLRKVNDKPAYFQKKPKAIITNGNLATILQDSPNFIFDGNFTDNVGTLYTTGSYDDSTIYVNPYFAWNQNLIILLYSENFWNFSVDLSQLESENIIEINQLFENINYKTYNLL